MERELLHLFLLLLLCRIGVNLGNGLGRRGVVARHPVAGAKVNDIHQHEAHTRRERRALQNVVDALKVHIHAALVVARRRVEQVADGGKKAAHAFDLVLLWVCGRAQQAHNTRVHNAGLQHLELEQLAHKLHQTEATALGLLLRIVLIRKQLGALVRLVLLLLLRAPALLKVALAPRKQVLAEQHAAAVLLLLLLVQHMVLDLGVQVHLDLGTQLRIHLTPRRLVDGFFKHQRNDLPQRAAVRLVNRLVRKLDNLVRDRLKLLNRELVKKRLDLALDHQRGVELVLLHRLWLPPVLRVRQWRDLVKGNRRTALLRRVHVGTAIALPAAVALRARAHRDTGAHGLARRHRTATAAPRQ